MRVPVLQRGAGREIREQVAGRAIDDLALRKNGVRRQAAFDHLRLEVPGSRPDCDHVAVVPDGILPAVLERILLLLRRGRQAVRLREELGVLPEVDAVTARRVGAEMTLVEQIGDEGLSPLKALKKLQSLYLHNQSGSFQRSMVSEWQRSHPGLRIFRAGGQRLSGFEPPW